MKKFFNLSDNTMPVHWFDICVLSLVLEASATLAPLYHRESEIKTKGKRPRWQTVGLLARLLLLILQPWRSEGLTTFETVGTIVSLLPALLSVALVWAAVLRPDSWVPGLQDEDAQEIDLFCLADDVCRQRTLDSLNVTHRVQVDFGERMRLDHFSIGLTDQKMV